MIFSPYTHAPKPRPDCEYCGTKGTGLICIDCSRHRNEILEHSRCPQCYSSHFDWWAYRNNLPMNAWMCADCGSVWYEKWFPDEEAKMVLSDNAVVIDIPGSKEANAITHFIEYGGKTVIIRGFPPCPECGEFLTVDAELPFPVICTACGTVWSIEDFVDIATRNFEEE